MKGSFLKQWELHPQWHEFIRFCIVGAVCTLVDSVIFYTVISFCTYHIALISGYIISLTINYLLTVYWTFRTIPTKNNLAGIIIAHLFNLFVIRMGLMWLFINIVQIHTTIAYIPTLAISVFTNFIIVKSIINIQRNH